jgi:hypothetical protein
MPSRIALVRMRCHPPTKAYVERRTNQGLSKLDIMRCLEALHRPRDLPAPHKPATHRS